MNTGELSIVSSSTFIVITDHRPSAMGDGQGGKSRSMDPRGSLWRTCFIWWTSIKIDEACRKSCLRWFWTSDHSLEKERERERLPQTEFSSLSVKKGYRWSRSRLVRSIDRVSSEVKLGRSFNRELDLKTKKNKIVFRRWLNELRGYHDRAIEIIPVQQVLERKSEKRMQWLKRVQKRGNSEVYFISDCYRARRSLISSIKTSLFYDQISLDLSLTFTSNTSGELLAYSSIFSSKSIQISARSNQVLWVFFLALDSWNQPTVFTLLVTTFSLSWSDHGVIITLIYLS